MPEAAERMSRVDTAWLRMDNAVNLMMIVGVWLIEPAITPGCAARAHPDPPLASRASARRSCTTQRARPGPPTTSSTSTTTCSSSRSCAQARASARPAGLRRRTGDDAARSGPAAVAVPSHRALRGGSALIARIHHCIGDGIAPISVALSIADGGAPPPQRNRHAGDDEPQHDWIAEALIRPLTHAAVKALGRPAAGVARVLDALAESAGRTAARGRAPASAAGGAATWPRSR